MSGRPKLILFYRTAYPRQNDFTGGSGGLTSVPRFAYKVFAEHNPVSFRHLSTI